MPTYRRSYIPGSTVFLTLVTYRRQPIFLEPAYVVKLKQACATLMEERPFTIEAAVILPDHIHFLWTLPVRDNDYSYRVGRMKVLFTRSLRGVNALPQDVSASRQKHRESDVWQRRFYEHTIADELDLQQHLDYLHFNPVKHGLVRCVHQWESSSFHRSVQRGMYPQDWGCQCDGKVFSPNINRLRDIHSGE